MAKKPQVLVLGCTGKLGLELVKRLGDDCVPKSKEALNILNYKKTRELITRTNPAAVINCAAITNKRYTDRDRIEAWRTNVEAVDNVVKSCAIAGVPYVHISCNSVFGADISKHTPYTEADAVGSVDYYGNLKIMAEHAVLRLGQCICPDFWKAGFKYWIIRTSTLYELPTRHSLSWIYQLLRAGTSKQLTELSLPNDVFSTPTYVPHFVNSLVWLIEHRNEIISGIYNISSSGTASMLDVGMHLSSSLKKVIPIGVTDRTTYARLRNIDPLAIPQYDILDCDKFNEISSVKMPTWEEGIEEFAFAWSNIH